MGKQEAAIKTSKKVKRAKAEPPKKKWVPLSLDEARREIQTSVHFYSKCTNTNAAAAGVRLPSNEARMLLPLVGFSTTDLDRRHTTYTVGAPLIGPFGQVMSVLEGVEYEKYKDIPEGQREICREAADVLEKGFEIRTIDPRLRQVLLPDETGEYIALTPLHSDKFSQVLDQRRREEADAGFQWRGTVNLDLGGAKKQNMARRARYMCNVLNFPAPKEDQRMRKAMAIFHKGPTFESLLPAGLLKDFAQNVLSEGVESSKDGVAWRNYLEGTARMACAHVLSAADALTVEQQDALGLTDGDALTSKSVSQFLRALLDESLRDKAWKSEFARRLIGAIETFQVNAQGSRLAESGSFGQLIQFVEEEVL